MTLPMPTPHTSGYLTCGSIGGAHSRGIRDTNTNTDTPETNDNWRGPCHVCTYKKYQIIIPDTNNDHTIGPTGSDIWRYDTQTVSIYAQQDAASLTQLFEPWTILCTSDTPHHRGNHHKIFKTCQWPWNKISVDNRVWKIIWKPFPRQQYNRSKSYRSFSCTDP